MLIIRNPAAEEAIYLDATLKPDCGMTRPQVIKLLRIIAMVSIGGGAILYLAGAWPVIGFLGLDVLLIYAGFAAYQHYADKTSERVTVTSSAITIIRTDGQEANINPGFARAYLDLNGSRTVLIIGERQTAYEIGRFLGQADKEAFIYHFTEAQRVRQAALIQRS